MVLNTLVLNRSTFGDNVQHLNLIMDMGNNAYYEYNNNADSSIPLRQIQHLNERIFLTLVENCLNLETFDFSQNEGAWLGLVEVLKRRCGKYLRALPSPKLMDRYSKYHILCAFLSRDSLETVMIDSAFRRFDEDYGSLEIFPKLTTVIICRSMFETIYDVEDLAKSCPNIKELEIDLNGTIGVLQSNQQTKKVDDVQPHNKLSKLTVNGPSDLYTFSLEYYLCKFPHLKSVEVVGTTEYRTEVEPLGGGQLDQTVNRMIKIPHYSLEVIL